jgi:predicted nucleic acid-binding protein
MGKVSSKLGQRIYIDTNIVIYAIEGLANYAAQVQPLLDAMDAAEVFIVTSELTLAETLVGPIKAQNLLIQKTYHSFLTTTDILEVVPVSRRILEEAAQLRATSKLKLPDAIHLATALQYQCESFLTNDIAFKSLNLPQVKMLADVDLT